MGLCSTTVNLVGLGFLLMLFYRVVRRVLYPKAVRVPKIEEKWWGPRDKVLEDTSIKPFKINVSDEVLKDLEIRLENTVPFQPPLEGVNQHYGINTNLLSTIVDFWRTKYNWREREAFLNQYPQFMVSIQGLNIHFLHIKPQNVGDLKVLPLLLVHGWPGSIREFYEIIPLLTTPQEGRQFVFELVIPSLPGYGFSEAAVKPGLGTPQMALIFKQLMDKLNYDRYYVQGGDWGSVIITAMATLFPENVIGMHSNMPSLMSLGTQLKLMVGAYLPTPWVTKEEEQYIYPLGKKYATILGETGYMHLQATKPDTAGVALRESPAGLAAYIIEKFTAWTNPAFKDLEDGGLPQKYTYTKLLDNVMIYWVTKSITTSFRLYAETFGKNRGGGLDKCPVTVPSACARFIHEMFVFPPEKLLRKKFQNLLHVPILDGGHFAAFEVPEVLAKDIYEFTEKAERYDTYLGRTGSKKEL